MNGEPHTHDVVALLEDVQTKHFESGEPLLLRRGQMGTVVMIYKDGACEVEFVDRDGRAYALLPLRADKLMVLHDSPEHATA
jgi:CRP-like cAMP-binding protein